MSIMLIFWGDITYNPLQGPAPKHGPPPIGHGPTVPPVRPHAPPDLLPFGGKMVVWSTPALSATVPSNAAKQRPVPVPGCREPRVDPGDGRRPEIQHGAPAFLIGFRRADQQPAGAVRFRLHVPNIERSGPGLYQRLFRGVHDAASGKGNNL